MLKIRFLKNHIEPIQVSAKNWNITTNNDKNRENNFSPSSNVYFRLPLEGDLLLNTMIRFKLDISEFIPTNANPKNLAALTAKQILVR